MKPIKVYILIKNKMDGGSCLLNVGHTTRSGATRRANRLNSITGMYSYSVHEILVKKGERLKWKSV